jgi:hypothetical protein
MRSGIISLPELSGTDDNHRAFGDSQLAASPPLLLLERVAGLKNDAVA